MIKFIKQITVRKLLILIVVLIIPVILIISYNFITKISKDKEFELAKQREKQVLDSISSVKTYDTLSNLNISGLTNCVLKTKYFENELIFIFYADIIDPLSNLPGSAKFPKYPKASDKIILNFYDKDNFLLISKELNLINDLTTFKNNKGKEVEVSANSKITEFTKDKYLKINHWDFHWQY